MKDTFRKLLGERIKELRLLNNMSQRQLANSLGVGNSSIVSIEKGNRNMTIQTLERIAVALGIDVMVLVKINSGVEMPDIINGLIKSYPIIPDTYAKAFTVFYEQGLRFSKKEDYYYLFLFMQKLNSCHEEKGMSEND